MKPHNNIDAQIRKMMNESADFFDVEAGNSKERIWQQVQLRKQSRPALFWIRALAAACILLLIATSIVTISKVKADKKIKTLVASYNSLQIEVNSLHENTLTQEKPVMANGSRGTDTVYIEKTVTVAKPVIITEQIIDTVYMERKVYLEKEKPQELISASDHRMPDDTASQSLTANGSENQIYIRNNNSRKQEKKRKFQIKFGGNKNQSDKGSFALKTAL